MSLAIVNKQNNPNSRVWLTLPWQGADEAGN